MTRLKAKVNGAGWMTAATLSLLVHCAVFSCGAWVINQRQDYVSMDLTRFQGTPVVARQAQEVSHRPKPERQPEPVQKKPEPAPTATEPMRQPAEPQPESVSAAEPYLGTDKLSNRPFFRRNVKPVYPKQALTAGQEARVLAEVFINERGLVDDVRIVKSGGEVFDTAVMAALKQSLFEPGYVEGRPVAAKVLIPYSFRMN
ncbi:MAG: TonB family protein [Nitrospinae bacterium]|nr:TonB family protein [Nitrospinota bacterium]